MGPVCCMVWEGDNAVKTGRVMLGATNPADSAPGTIRGDLCIHVGRNICHGSDSVESAEHEVCSLLLLPAHCLRQREHARSQMQPVDPSTPPRRTPLLERLHVKKRNHSLLCYDH